MFFLRRRRLRGDVIKVFKIINGIDKVNLKNHFDINENRRIRKHIFFFLLEGM